jgi:glutaredoxin
MFDWLTFNEVSGSHDEKKIQVLALKSCAFCKRAMEFLGKHDIAYEYAYVDDLSGQDKKRLKEEFKDRFGERPLFPTVIVDDADYQLGFIEKAWEKMLNLSSQEG